MGEISSISKHDGRLVGHAKDPITSGLALEAFLPERHWERTGAEALVLGAGGSAIAITWYLLQKPHGAQPALADHRDQPQHAAAGGDPPLPPADRRRHARSSTTTRRTPETTDATHGRLKPGSLVINATGLGKDAPGSPLTDAAVWPERRHRLGFQLPRRPAVPRRRPAHSSRRRNLQIEDGWIYFIHGWTRVIAEVFHIDIPTSGPRFDELSRIARRHP